MTAGAQTLTVTVNDRAHTLGGPATLRSLLAELGLAERRGVAAAVNGQVVIRPMMYLALSYDHRVIDGKEAVTFLVSVKDHIEDPQRLVLDL